MSERHQTERALGGRRVLDLADGKGVYCAKMLAELGADVIRVERPEGDPMRRLPPFEDDVPHPERSLYFAYYNVGKRGITLNLECADGQAIFKRLVQTTDIVLETFPPAVLKRLGLDYPVLREINPGIIMVSITNFGQTGPYKDYKANDIVGFAMSAALHQSGDPEKPPCNAPGQLAYDSTSVFAAQSALIALYYRSLTGRGQHIDISMQTAGVGALTDWEIPLYSFFAFAPPGYARVRVREGGVGAGVPGNIHPTKDGGWVRTVVLSPWQFRRLTEWMGNPEALADPAWDQLPHRAKNRQFVERITSEWTVNYTKEELRDGAFERGVPLAPVQSPAEFFEDPQTRAREYFIEVEHAEIGRHYCPGAPYKLTETPCHYCRPAPLLGEHNAEVYQNELGFSRQELATLRAAGVI